MITLTEEEKRAKKNAYQKLWNARNKERVSEINKVSQKRYKENHPDLYKAKSKEKQKRYAQLHPERVKETKANYHAANKEEIAAKKKAYRLANPEKIKALSAASRARNKEKRNASSREWNANNSEAVKENMGLWRSENKDKTQVHDQNKRARKLNNVGSGKLSSGLAKTLYAKQNGCCVYCKVRFVSKEYHLDHIMPLALGGAHADENIQLLCANCNLSKHDTHPDVYMRRKGIFIWETPTYLII